VRTVFPYRKSVRTHATKHATNCIEKTIPKNCHILGNVLEISRFPSPISRFPSPKIQFSSPKIDFPHRESDLPKLAFYFLQRLSTFFNGFLTFFNGFLLSPMAFQFSPTAFQFSSMAFHFPRNLRNLFMARSIQKIAVRASYFLPLAPRAL
jgi:hypothetical protein